MELFYEAIDRFPDLVTMSFRAFPFRSFLLVALVAVTSLASSACGDERRLRASYPVVADTLVGYAFTGTNASAATALSSTFPGALRGVTVPADGNNFYDVVFDIDGSGNVLLMPARVIVNPIAGAPSVGLVKVAQPYDSVTRAPDVYYRPDTTLVVAPNETVALLIHRSSGTDICWYLSDPRLFAKLVIDSVNVTTRAIYLRHTNNPNCGYRSLVPGFPTN